MQTQAVHKSAPPSHSRAAQVLAAQPSRAPPHVEAGNGCCPPLKHQEPQAVGQRELCQPLIQLPLQQAAGAGCLRRSAQQGRGISGCHGSACPGVQAADRGSGSGCLQHGAPAAGWECRWATAAATAWLQAWSALCSSTAAALAAAAPCRRRCLRLSRHTVGQQAIAIASPPADGRRGWRPGAAGLQKRAGLVGAWVEGAGEHEAVSDHRQLGLGVQRTRLMARGARRQRCKAGIPQHEQRGASHAGRGPIVHSLIHQKTASGLQAPSALKQ